MLVFVKLGGSLITDKRVRRAVRRDVIQRVASEITQALAENPSLQLVIGHGSGSFGHFSANAHQTAKGVQTAEQWHGFAEVAFEAAELNQIVLTALREAGLPAMKFQPSATAQSESGKVVSLDTRPIRLSLQRGLIPLVYGDVGFDEIQGGTILSTEAIFFYLARVLSPDRIILLGEVEGVLDADGDVISTITPSTLPQIEASLGGSGGIDVTGGMETKVKDMLALTAEVPSLRIQIASGARPHLLKNLLTGDLTIGTSLISG